MLIASLEIHAHLVAGCVVDGNELSTPQHGQHEFAIVGDNHHYSRMCMAIWWQFSIATFHQSNQKVFRCKTDWRVCLVGFQVIADAINKKWDCAKELETGCSKAAVVHPK